MSFRIFRIDTDDSSKIDLVSGTYIVGRGKYDIKDRRVSRKHGMFEVTKDSLILTALHMNPCFYIKKGTMEVHLVKQNNSVTLTNGDKVGFLPDSVWFEVSSVPINDDEKGPHNECQDKTITDDMTIDSGDGSQNNDNSEVGTNAPAQAVAADDKMDQDIENCLELDTENMNEQLGERYGIYKDLEQLEQNDLLKSNTNNDSSTDCSSGTPESVQVDQESAKACMVEAQQSTTEVNEDAYETFKDPVEPHIGDEAETTVNKESGIEQNDSGNEICSNSATTANSDKEGSPSLITSNQQEPIAGPSSSQENSSPLKRSHNGDENEEKVDVKKIKIEQEVKMQLDPDPEQAGPSVPNPVPHVPGMRERCMYGVQCYRRNPKHLARYSHPTDADWGEGAQAPCPWGAQCTKRDPRHWRDHRHPPGKMPPPPQGKKTIKNRQRKRDSPTRNLVTGKRVRASIKKNSWSGSDESDSDPFKTDESDSEWEPSSEYTETQD